MHVSKAQERGSLRTGVIAALRLVQHAVERFERGREITLCRIRTPEAIKRAGRPSCVGERAIQVAAPAIVRNRAGESPSTNWMLPVLINVVAMPRRSSSRSWIASAS